MVLLQGGLELMVVVTPEVLSLVMLPYCRRKGFGVNGTVGIRLVLMLRLKDELVLLGLV